MDQDLILVFIFAFDFEHVANYHSFFLRACASSLVEEDRFTNIKAFNSPQLLDMRRSCAVFVVAVY